jgi:gas vesicle protein
MIGRRDRRRQNIKRVAIGSSIAAAAGYVAGLLTAPKSGKETRKDIKQAADKGVAGAEDELKQLRVELDKVVKEAKVSGGKAGAKAQKEFKELVAKAKDSKDKAGEVLGAIRKGDARDEDLAKALKQAKHSLHNLRTYLKK